MATKTATKTENKAEVSASTKIVNAIKSFVDATVLASSRYVLLYEATKAEVERLKLEKDDATKMVRFSYREAFGIDTKDAEATKAFDQKHLGDVSRIVRMVFPENAKAAQELAKGIAHNRTAKGPNRIGDHTLVDFARAKKTFNEVIGHKRAVASKRATARVDGAPAYTLETAKNELGATLGKARKAGILDEVEEAFAELLAENQDKAEQEQESKKNGKSAK